MNISPDPEKFIDAQSLMIHGRVDVKMRKEEAWVKCERTDDKWGVINNFHQSLFSSVFIKVNDCEIGNIGSNSYPYTPYLQTLLGCSNSSAGGNILSQRGFIKDDIDHMVKPNTGSDSSFSKKRDCFHAREMVDFNIQIHNDLNNCEKYIPPNTEISITLRKADDKFLIWKVESDNKEYKIFFGGYPYKILF